MLAIAMLYACQKDTFPLTMDGAIKKVEKTLKSILTGIGMQVSVPSAPEQFCSILL
jgi:hypothetical protein